MNKVINHGERKGVLTISDIEKVISLFRETGSESELSAFIKELTDEIRKEATTKTTIKTPVKDSSDKEGTFHGWIPHIPEETKSKSKKWLRTNVSILLKNKYFRKFSMFSGSFLAIYLLFNLPMYVTRVGYYLDGARELKTITYSQIEQTPMAKSAPLDPGELVPPGSVLSIPKLAVNAPIVFVPSQEEKDIQSGLQSGVVHYAGTARPGEAGNTFITGHSSNYWWDKGKYNRVFVLLDKMIVGDRSVIYHNGNKYIYEVTEKSIVEPTDVSSLNQTEEPVLTLMTCYPPGTTSKRLIVRLKQISPQYFAPRIVEKEKTIEVPRLLPTSDNTSFWSFLGKLF